MGTYKDIRNTEKMLSADSLHLYKAKDRDDALNMIRDVLKNVSNPNVVNNLIDRIIEKNLMVLKDFNISSYDMMQAAKD